MSARSRSTTGRRLAKYACNGRAAPGRAAAHAAVGRVGHVLLRQPGLVGHQLGAARLQVGERVLDGAPLVRGDRGRLRLQPSGVPKTHRPIGARRQQETAVGRQRNSRCPLIVPRDAQDRFDERDVPDSHRIVLRTGYQGASIAADRKAIDRSGMTEILPQLATGLEIPQAGRFVGACRHGLLALGNKLCHQYIRQVSSQHDRLGTLRPNLRVAAKQVDGYQGRDRDGDEASQKHGGLGR